MKKNYFTAATTHTIVVHKSPHVEELLALVLLKMNGTGESIFPGVKTAKIEFWNAGTQTPDGASWKDWHQKGYLLVGVGGSCFDEHTTRDHERKEGCSATLIAEALGLIDAPWLEKILRYVTINDTKGASNPYELGSLIMMMNEISFEADPDATIEWGMQILKAILRKQILFFQKTGEEFKNCSTTFKCLHNGKSVTVCTVISDDTQIAAYARSKHGANADVIIQRYSTGHTFVTTKNMSQICLDGVIKSLRITERVLNGEKTPLPASELEREGNAKGAECFYYDKQARRILNGSRSNTSVPPTKIPLEKIVKLVEIGLNNSFFRQKIK